MRSATNSTLMSASDFAACSAVVVSGSAHAVAARWRSVASLTTFGSGDACGHVVIRHSKTEDGLRILPLDPEAESAIQRYISYGRPRYTGHGEEPLFLTDDGKSGLSAHGMSALRGRIKKRAEAEGLHGFMWHRARGYATKRLQRKNVPTNVIMQIGGWTSPEMVRRYVGEYDPSEIKAFPLANLREVL
jgi:integrase